MKHNILYCNTKNNGFIAMTFTNPDAFFDAIPHANDNSVSELYLLHMVKDITQSFKKSLRREIFGRKGRCHTCKGFIEYQGDGKWGCEDCGYTSTT